MRLSKTLPERGVTPLEVVGRRKGPLRPPNDELEHRGLGKRGAEPSSDFLLLRMREDCSESKSQFVMVKTEDAQKLESDIRRVLREIEKSVSVTETYNNGFVNPTFADAGLLYEFFEENWGIIRNLREGNHVITKKRKENILAVYDYLRNMADRIESGQKIYKSEQLSISTYLERIES